jgi:TolB protein
MTRILRSAAIKACTFGVTAAGALALLTLGGRAQTPQPPPAQPQQPTDVTTTITSGTTAPPRLAVPEFLALSHDAETVAAARTITEVLWDDLNFEREFLLVPRDVNRTIPAAASMTNVPFDRWREVNADGVIIGTVQKTASGLQVDVRLYGVRNQGSAFGKEYHGSAANPRLFAHTISDDIHLQQRGLHGVARTKLTFDSDRDGERMGGTVEEREVKEIYISDYDGASQRRVTTSRTLSITPEWSPDARSIAYTSYRRGLPNIFVSHIYEGTLDELTRNAGNNFTPAWSPDGTKICFSSTRDGNAELYVMNRDGSGLRRLTNNPAADISPTWSPSGTQIAFTSDRSGTPQIYVIGADGLGLRKLTSESYADRPTWSAAPYNEIAYAARTGPGNDIKILDVATGTVRQLTFGEGTNESPSFAPNGRHLVFMSTRSGKAQIFTIARDGKDLHQVTKTGDNYQPNWSR